VATEADAKFEREIAAGMTRAFDDKATEEQELDLDTARLIVFSDLHRGAGTAPTTSAAPSEPIRPKYSPDEVIKAYPQSLELEGEFHKKGRYERFWGNHDDL
jgi:hypothetical protein